MLYKSLQFKFPTSQVQEVGKNSLFESDTRTEHSDENSEDSLLKFQKLTVQVYIQNICLAGLNF